MDAHQQPVEFAPHPNQWTSADVESILRERAWLIGDTTPEHRAWLDRAALLLSPHAENREALSGLLELVFRYDAAALLTQVDSQVAISRYAARDVLRETGRMLLEFDGLDSDRFKQIINALREMLEISAREILMPIRLALGGRIGEGQLDRVILLLDGAAALPWNLAVKGTRARIVEFYAASD